VGWLGWRGSGEGLADALPHWKSRGVQDCAAFPPLPSSTPPTPPACRHHAVPAGGPEGSSAGPARGAANRAAAAGAEEAPEERPRGARMSGLMEDGYDHCLQSFPPFLRGGGGGGGGSGSGPPPPPPRACTHTLQVQQLQGPPLETSAQQPFSHLLLGEVRT